MRYTIFTLALIAYLILNHMDGTVIYQLIACITMLASILYPVFTSKTKKQ